MALAIVDRSQLASQLSKRLMLVIGLVALLAVSYFLFYPIFVMKVLCFALFAAAFNLLVGYVGLMSFGHAAFFGGAAYVTAHAAKEWGLTPDVALLMGAVAAAALGLIMGLLAIRRQGIYFAMISLALAQMFYFLCNQAEFTHGEDGIQGVPRGEVFGIIPLDSNASMYVFVCAVFLIGLAVIWRVVHSPFGHVLNAIRQNEARAISLGYKVERYKLGAFVMSATLAGLAGGTKALVFQLASLNDVAWNMSGEVVLMALLGGIGTFVGPVVGAVIVVSLENFMALSTVPIPLVLGVVFVACVLLFRRGIVGEINALSARRGAKR